jgi:thiosulfate/3-mercaptopyruvate sulfurtransferase
MTYANPDALVTTDWLAEHLNDPDIRVVDGSSFLPNVPRDAQEEYAQKHIPGAVLIDIEEVSDHSSDLPHMLPTPDAFAAKVGALGIGSDNMVVVYDSQGVRTSPRVWWMFRVFGHDNVTVLDGGLPKWEAENRPVADGVESPAPQTFTASLRPGLVRSFEQVAVAVDNSAEQVIDARPAGRFAGTDAEPRPGIPSGHMPGSSSMPVGTVVDAASGTVLPAAAIQANFDAAGVNMGGPIITSCGSGVAACTTSLGLYLLGHKESAVYDGSWSDWGSRDETPKNTL